MRLHEIRRVLKPRTEVFAYAADLSNTVEWDPSVVTATQIEPGPPRVGTKYELEVRFGGATMPMVYEITELEPDYRVLLRGRSGRLDSVDEIKFIDDGENTVIDYTVTLTFHDWLRFVGPLARPSIRRAGSRSIDALVAVLEG